MAHKVPTIIGLLIALLAPVLPFTALMKWLGDPPSLTARLAGQIYYLAIVAAVIFIVVGWEKRPLASIGLKPPTLATVVWALIAAAVLVKLIVPAAMYLVSLTGLPLFDKGLAKIGPLPFWFRLLAVIVTGGIFEEVIYRGFLTERLSELTGSRWVGGLLSLSAFAWMHYPLWGLGPVLTFYITGGFLTALYFWRGDLLTTILCHILVDMLGLVF
jgi:uncharacterized protein